MEVRVLAARPVAVSAVHGDWVRVTGIVISSGPQTTLLLGSDSDAVKVCGMHTHSRRLKYYYSMHEISVHYEPPKDNEDLNNEGCSCDKCR